MTQVLYAVTRAKMHTKFVNALADGLRIAEGASPHPGQPLSDGALRLTVFQRL